MKVERRVISVIVQNEHSVLTRITGLFAARGYNIETLTVAPIPDSDMSRLTIETKGNIRVIEQIIKQLHKLIPTFKVIEHEEMIEKEMVLMKFPINESLANIQALCVHLQSSCSRQSMCIVLLPCMLYSGPDTTSQFNGKGKLSSWEAWVAFPSNRMGNI